MSEEPERVPALLGVWMALVLLALLLGVWQLFEFNRHVGWAAIAFLGAAMRERLPNANVIAVRLLALLGVWQLFEFNWHVGWAAVLFLGAAMLVHLPGATMDVIEEVQRHREENLTTARAEREEEARREWEAELAEREALRAQRDRED